MSTEFEESVTPDFRLDVQGLRAIAVGLVILYHFNLLGFNGGYVGVDVFFVISGFVIAGVLLRDTAKHGRPSLLQFYARRARRIIPASTTVLVTTVVASYLLFGRYATAAVANDARAAALFVANYHFAWEGTNYFASQQAPSALLHFWSLAVEEQFYFVIPALVLLVATVSRNFRRHLALVVTVIVVASLVWSYLSTNNDPITAYYSILTRAWELGVGILVALAVRRLSTLRASVAATATWLGVGLILAAAWGFSGTTVYPGLAAVVPVAGAALVILGGAARPRMGASSVLSTRSFVYVGDLSYSLYLWHFPVIALAAQRQSTPLSLATRLVCLVIAVVLSLVSFYVVERPFRSARLLRKRSSAALGVGAVGISLSLLVATVALPSAGGSATTVAGHPALAQLEQQVESATAATSLPSSTFPALSLTLDATTFSIPSMIANCSPPSAGYVVPACAYGDTSSNKTVVLYGNSQAQMWAPALDWLGKRDHFKVVPIMKAACGVFIDRGYVGPNGQVGTLCLHFAQWSTQKINALQPALVIIATTPGEQLKPGASASQLGPNGRLPASSTEQIGVQRMTKDYQKFLAGLHLAKKSVVMLSNIPIPAHPSNALAYPNECLLEHPHAIQQCSSPQSGVDTSEWHQALVAATAATSTALIDVDPLLCSKGMCPTIVDRILVHFDTDHLSGPYTLYAAFAFGQLLAGYLPSADYSAAL